MKNIKYKKSINKFVFNIICILILLFSMSLDSFMAERDLGKEQQLGRKLSKDIEKKYEVVKDSAQNSLLIEIGNKLARASDLDGMNYHFKILKIEGPNAFSIPGGY
ncbi:MAG TPA: hypothetical protein ENI51_07045, partial [Candidatus Atribacteria bacterium]|nr:hypothetical protein [Candidatus Atribacteria bacterium]